VSGGAEENRTLDLLNAIQVVYAEPSYVSLL
jgi:hypothetical protein